MGILRAGKFGNPSNGWVYYKYHNARKGKREETMMKIPRKCEDLSHSRGNVSLFCKVVALMTPGSDHARQDAF